jgi:DNA-directed RNA polymerase subunit RPC12/RpoP
MIEQEYVQDNEAVEVRFKKYRNMLPFKNKSDEELMEMARRKLKEEFLNPTEKAEKVDTFGVEDMFTDSSEKTMGVSKMKDYLKEYQLESPAEKMLLKQLVYSEVIQARLQRELNDSHNKSSVVSDKILKTAHANLEQISNLVEKLGINKSKNKVGDKSALEIMQKKFEKWRENNQLSRTRACPHCGKSILWKMRTDKWELLKHPFIQDRILINDTLLGMLGDNRITAKEYADIMGTSEDYIYWMLSKLTNEKKNHYKLYNVKKPDVKVESNDTDDN